MANVIKRISYDPVGGANNASGVSYDNTTSGLAADNVQELGDELAAENDAHDILISNAQTAINNHIADATDAHDASAISVSPAGNLAADDVQEALVELQGDIDALDSRLDSLEPDVADLITLSGVAANSTTLGTFTGTIIPDNSNNKQAFQSLETFIQALPSPFYYAGTYNATTNSPALSNLDSGVNGKLYYVTVAGTQNFGAGAITFAVGDKVVNNGISWDKWDMTDEVASVNGQTGIVVLDTDEVAEGVTNLYFSDERAQDAVGGALVDSASVDFTYNDVANTITAVVLPAGVDHDALANFVANKHVDHSAVAINAGSGLTGGGDITATRTISMQNVGTAGTYGSASLVPVFTTDAQGRVSAVTDTAISITSAAVTDFNEAAQDAVGGILTDSASVDFTYNDAGNTISAAVLPAGVDHDQLQNFVANKHVDHSAVQIATAAATSGLAGGGDITATRNLVVDITGTTALGTTPDGADEFLIWDSSASARKKVTYTQLLAGVDVGSAGDINETSFSLANNQAAAADVTGFLFANGTVRGFEALVTVYIDATSDLFEEYEIDGIQRGADWVITVDSTGDDSLVEFSITSLGQIQYTSANYAGFASGTIKFRAITTSV